VGRKPNTEGLALEGAGFSADEKGLIGINGQFQTGSPTVYAIGDVVEGPMLAHRAEEEGVAVAELLAGKDPHIDYSLIPNVVYTAPEIAGVGLTEQETEELGLETMTGTFPFAANSRANCMAVKEGLVKVIGHKPTGRLIGLHIMGHGASEMVHEGVIGMKTKAKVSDIAHACHAHPTLSEAIKEAAMAAIDKPIHM
jgi:dihydrolipoamide dehydrogenase